MRFLKIAFWLALAVWIGGGLLTMQYGRPSKRLELLAYGASDHDVLMMNVRGVSINLFGPIAIITGLLLAGAWIYKRTQQKSGEHPVEPTLPAQSVLEKRSPPPTTAHPIDSPTVSCTFSGWARDGNRIVQEYKYRGQGLDHRTIVELTVERAAVAVLRFVHFWVSPATGDDGLGEVSLTDEISGESVGWVPSQISTAAGTMTLMDARSREGADAIWRMFAAGRDLEFAARLNGEALMSLPMSNNSGVQGHYEAILRSLNQ